MPRTRTDRIPFKPLFVTLCLLATLAVCLPAAVAQDMPFSGPQVGEKLPGFELEAAFPTDSPKTMNPVRQAGESPLLVIFVHELTRPNVAVIRALGNYAKQREADGLKHAIVFLGDDKTALRERLTRARRALPDSPNVGISPDGIEGPGSLGLNRKMSLTILVANKQKVTGNFALVQPSVQADVMKVVDAIIAQIGGERPKLETLVPQMRRPAMDSPRGARDPELTGLLRQVINKQATNEQVDQAAAKLEKFIEGKPALQRQLGEITRTVSNSDRFDQYGTEHARTYLKKWAEKYGAAAAGRKSDR